MIILYKVQFINLTRFAVFHKNYRYMFDNFIDIYLIYIFWVWSSFLKHDVTDDWRMAWKREKENVNLILLISALLLIHFMISFIKPKLCSFFYLSSFLLLVCPHSLRRDICNSFSSKSLISPKNFCIKKHLKMLLTASYRRTGTPLYKISCFIFLQFTGVFFSHIFILNIC